MKNSNFLTIAKKELKRFFGDRRLFFSTVIMPGLMIYVLYTIMGDVMMKSFSTDEEYEPVVYACEMPASVDGLLKELEIPYKEVTADEVDGICEEISEQQADMLLVFPEHFDEDVAVYVGGAEAVNPAPQIEIYYNSASVESSSLYSTLLSVLGQYEAMLTNKFDINADLNTQYDLATEEDTTAKIFSMLVPMLLIMMLMSGCMSVTPDAIAGEKERGTMATLLVTPVKRGELAIGKIVSLSIVGLLSGISSSLGVMLSLPKLMGGEMEGLSASVYSAKDYAVLMVVACSTVLVIITLFSLISTYAKSVKEAGTLSSPLMIIGTVVAVMSSMNKATLPMYLIPIYNSAQCMNGIFSMEYTATQILLTVASNLVIAGIGVFIMTRMFDSEKIMFSR